MQKEIAELYTAALLHDIGKISERAGNKLSLQSERMKEYICPKDKVTHQFGYLHTAHTNEFFESIQGWLPSELDAGEVANLASYHHSPDAGNPRQLIIQQADWMSAGQDRQEDENQSGVRDHANAIFSTAFSSSDHQTSKGMCLPLIPLQLNESVFPQPRNEGKATQDYQKLWNALLEHFRQLRTSNLSVFMEQIYWIYSLYTWCVPSHRSRFLSISLLDHSLTTAAFAGALYAFHSQTNTLDEKSIKDWNIRKFRLVSGDLSGIQSYLYHTTLDNPSGVSKRLRAKSFYLGLLTRLAGDLILDRLGLSCFNRVIDAGGNFTLLVPNTPQSIRILADTEQVIQKWFYTTFQGKLNLNLSLGMELSGEDFRLNRFWEIQERLSWRMDAAKARPLQSYLTENHQWKSDDFILPFDPSQMKESRQEGQNETAEDLFFNKLGKELTQARFLVVSANTAPKDSLAHPFGWYSFVLTDTPSLTSHVRSCIQFVPGLHRQAPAEIYCGAFFAGYVPRQTEADMAFYRHPEVSDWLSEQLSKEDEELFATGKPKSFAHLCADSFLLDQKNEIKGQPLLAVLKADVDRLGMLFSKGLQNVGASLSFYISLSRQMDLFFRGILPSWFLEPPQEHPDFRNIYTVYTGGDDLLLVGPWKTVLKFAVFLEKQFRRYVCQNTDITLSGGISVCHSRFPLAQVAEQAESALKKAKQDRNRICVFDTVLEWPDLEIALEDAKFLDWIMQPGGYDGIEVKKSFVYRLIRYCQMAGEPGKLKNLLWRSHLRYDIARNVKILDKQSKPPGLIRLEKMTALTKDTKKEMSRLKVAVTSCLYLNRGGK